jgi:hypothetical protein
MPSSQKPKQTKPTAPDSDLIEEAVLEEEAGFVWSPELQAKMALLSPHQRAVIIVLVLGQLQGYPRARFLLTYRSCPWCGHYSRNKALRDRHERTCRHRGGRRWQFIGTHTTFYRWLKEDPNFAHCLQQAQEEASDYALRDTLLILKFASLAAAYELRRQLEHGHTESSRRHAATAILDRSGLKDLIKAESTPQPTLWFERLRDA